MYRVAVIVVSVRFRFEFVDAAPEGVSDAGYGFGLGVCLTAFDAGEV
jgi:hypothetical protein